MAVKKRKRGRPEQSQSQLTAELIVSSAQGLMQENGKVPSIRQVSSVLGVDPMAIYYYFSSKSLLLEALTISLISNIYEPKQDGNWQSELEKLSKSYLALLKTHSGLLETLLSMKSIGPVQVFTQRLSTVLSPLKLSDSACIEARDLLADYIHGVALAIQCNPENLSTDCIDGPLNLIRAGLENR